MTVLAACQSAALRLVGRKPTAVFSSSNQFELEVAELATEVAVDIIKAYDWQALTKLFTIQGDAAATAFDLPADYDRMPVKGSVHSSAWQYSNFTPARDLDQWLNYQSYLVAGSPGVWVVLGGKMQIIPAMAATETARFYYVSRYIDKADTKTAFSSDSDEFKLDERLLTLGIIWRWRSQKRLEYAEDMKNYEIALEQAIARDRGSKMLVSGFGSFPGDVRAAYPGVLG